MPKHRVYRHAPIAEAVCELRFSPSPDWNLTVPGRLYEKIRRSYPGQPREQLNFQMGGLLVEPDSGRQSEDSPRTSAATFTNNSVRVRFSSKDGLRQVAVGPNILSVHDLQPYSGWSRFNLRIQKALAAYTEIMPTETIVRVGLRYINIISIPSTSVDLDDYFVPMIGAPTNIPVDLTGFLARIESVYTDRRAKLLLTFGSTKADPGHTGFAFDLDVIAEFDDHPLTPNNALEVINDLHERENQAFEAVITDMAREVFNDR